MLDIILKTLNNLTYKKIIIITLSSIAITAVSLITFIFSIKILLSNINLFSWQWVNNLIDYAGTSIAVIISLLLYPIITPIIAGLFSDKIAKTICKIDYKDKYKITSQPLTKIILQSIRFVGKLLLINILCLPLYFIPIVNIIIYGFINSYFLGREYFEMSAYNFTTTDQARKLRKENLSYIILSGLIILLISSTPILNLFAPIIAITMATHLFFKIV